MTNSLFPFLFRFSRPNLFVNRFWHPPVPWHRPLFHFAVSPQFVNCRIRRLYFGDGDGNSFTFIFAFAINWFYGIVYVFQNANGFDAPKNGIIVYLIMIIKFGRFIVFTRFTLPSHFRLDRLSVRCCCCLFFSCRLFCATVTFSLAVKWKVQNNNSNNSDKQIATFVSLRDFACEIGFGINASHRHSRSLNAMHKTRQIHFCLTLARYSTPPASGTIMHDKTTDNWLMNNRKWMKFSVGK